MTDNGQRECDIEQEYVSEEIPTTYVASAIILDHPFTRAYPCTLRCSSWEQPPRKSVLSFGPAPPSGKKKSALGWSCSVVVLPDASCCAARSRVHPA